MTDLAIGLLARADDRGIGYQTYEFYRHLRPYRTAVVDIDDHWIDHFDRFPGAAIFNVPGWHYDEARMRQFLHGLDVLFMVETPYDWHLLDWAREMGVRTVIQGNPELWVESRHTPDAWWWPTPWMLDAMPAGPVMPVPVPDDWPVLAGDPDDDVLTIVHVAGHRAKSDRNGTEIASKVVRSLEVPCRVRIIGQDGELLGFKPTPGGVELELIPDGVAERQDLYRGAHVVLLPRRYGGLSLPTQEALASGCVVIAPDCAPNDFWPTVRVQAFDAGTTTTKFGRVPLFTADSAEIVECISALHHDRTLLRYWRDEGLQWAEENRWRRWREAYEAQLACV